MNTKSPKELTYEWFERVWNQLDESAIPELMCESCDVQGLNLPEKGPAGFTPFYKAYVQTFSEIHVDIFELLQEGDRVAGHGIYKGVHNATGNKIEVHFSVSATVKDGKLTEARNVVDFTQMLSQLGMFNPESMAQVFAPQGDAAMA